MRRRSALSLLLIVGVPTSLFLSPAARATSDDAAQAPGPLAPAQVPEPLKPWISWALRGHEEELCPRASGDESGDAEPTCLWPSRLSLQLDAHGGTFSQGVRLYREAMVPLPGDSTAWPRELRVDGQPAPVVEEASGPVAWLKPGEHQLAGSFAWTKLPESLHVPQATGLIALTLRGKSVPSPSRDEDGLLWLQKEEEDEPGESRLEVRVWRQLIDEIPLRVDTRLELLVSGKNREVLLGRALLEGFTPLSLSSALPARLEPDGRLRVQVRPGTFRVDLVARRSGPVESLALPQDAQGPWSAEELWTFSARPDLRVAEIVGVPSIDPAQTNLPSEWRGLPTYRMRPGDTMRLVTQRRGDAEPAPDQLALERLLWLDFDGRGLTAQDHLSGTLTRSDRLEMPEPSQLGRVRAQGQDQLITRLSQGAAPGVELRQGILALEAESRAPLASGALSAVGWSHGVRSLSMHLVLPPGFRLLHASGADEVSPTWLQSWSLLDLFLVLLATLAAARLFGWPLGLAMFLGLGLSLPEGAPKWIWLLPLGAEALLRVLPAGRVQLAVRIARGAALGLLALMLAPFALHHLRVNLNPGLERDTVFAGLDDLSNAMSESAPAMAFAQLAPQAPAAAAAPTPVELPEELEAAPPMDRAPGGPMKRGTKGGGASLSLGGMAAKASAGDASRAAAWSASASASGYQQQLDLAKIRSQRGGADRARLAGVELARDRAALERAGGGGRAGAAVAALAVDERAAGVPARAAAGAALGQAARARGRRTRWPARRCWRGSPKRPRPRCCCSRRSRRRLRAQARRGLSPRPSCSTSCARG